MNLRHTLDEWDLESLGRWAGGWLEDAAGLQGVRGGESVLNELENGEDTLRGFWCIVDSWEDAEVAGAMRSERASGAYVDRALTRLEVLEKRRIIYYVVRRATVEDEKAWRVVDWLVGDIADHVDGRVGISIGGARAWGAGSWGRSRRRSWRRALRSLG